MSSEPSISSLKSYHHGDLRRSLLDTAILLIKQEGIEKLSMRKLADKVGVSQTAIYHHFGDKQALLNAMGEEGIEQFQALLLQNIHSNASAEVQLTEFAYAYVDFARTNPELYELMFGRMTWQASEEGSFQRAGHQSFRAFVQMVARFQQTGLLSAQHNPLRLAQTLWACLHGLCRMYNDGLHFSTDDIQDIAHYAVLALLKESV
jgi:AcrR family transcriptional regulator